MSVGETIVDGHPEGCFLFAGSASDGFFGPLEDHVNEVLCMSETDVAEYIRAARPDLFKKLHGLPIKSFEILFSDARSSQQTKASKSFQELQQPLHFRLALDGRAGSAIASSRIAPTSPSKKKLLDVQHKRHIQCRLLNGHHFLLQRVRHCSPLITCACPACTPTKTPLDFGVFFLTLLKDSNIRSGNFNNDSPPSYSLPCVEDLFRDESFPIPSPVHSQIIEANFDGTAEMPKRKGDSHKDGKIDEDSPKRSDFPFQYPSNSSIARRLRSERGVEIEEILKADEDQEHAYNEYSTEKLRLPDLTLRRPPNHARLEERYKKQGLTRDVYVKQAKQRKLDHDKALAAFEAEHAKDRDETPSPHDEDFNHELICYCREPEEGDGFRVIKCAGDSCMIGWFHLRCIEVDEIPYGGDKFYCEDCIDTAERDLEDLKRPVASDPMEQSTLLGGISDDWTALNETSDNAVPEADSESSEQGQVGNNRIPPYNFIKIPEEIAAKVAHDKNTTQLAETNGLDGANGAPIGESHDALPLPSFVAINDFDDPRNYPELLPDQFDGAQERSTQRRYLAPPRTRCEGRHKHSASASRAAPGTPLGPIPPPAGFTSTPFHGLAPFIYPSLSDSDRHALTPEEGRVVWCWRSSCPSTSLFEALPEDTRDRLRDEATRSTLGLGKWWAQEATRMGLRDRENKGEMPGLGELLRMAGVSNGGSESCES